MQEHRASAARRQSAPNAHLSSIRERHKWPAWKPPYRHMSTGISFLQRSAPDSFSLASHPLIPNSVNRFNISIAISLNLAPYPADGGSQGVFVHIVFIRIPQPFQKALPSKNLFGIFAEQVQHLILHRGKGKGIPI